MVKHVVMWKLKAQAEGASKHKNLQLMISMLQRLKETVPVIRALEVGVNFNPDPAAYDIVLITEFRNRGDLEAYQKHPDHQRVSDFIGRIREFRAVVDYEL